MIEIEGIVTRIGRSYSSEKTYIVSDGKTEFQIGTREYIPLGTAVKVIGELSGEKIIARKIETLMGEIAKDAIQRINEQITNTINVPSTLEIVKNETTVKFYPKMKEMTLRLICARKLNRPTIVRFHGDADGICSALAITSIINAKTYQQNSAIYNVKDALFDIENIGQETNPLAVFVDFGSGEKNLEAIKLLKAAGIEVLIIDHHPFVESQYAHLFNPLAFDPNSSKYCCGYLCAEIAILAGAPKDKMLDLAKTAAAGDKSDILEIGEKEVTKALVLDFLSAHASFGNKLEFYKNVLAKEDLFNSLAKQAEEEISEASRKIIRSEVKRVNAGTIEIVSFCLNSFITKGEWPPSSKITTRIFEIIVKETPEVPIICLGYNERTIIIRINERGAKMGLDSNKIAQDILEIMPDFVEGGGGHIRAGAIRVREGFVREVLGQIIKRIEERVES
ncbi:hypothetical protein HY990_06895 [Candidatus Micrarchaeota archaeon]|nr:hypothetical protein [Candidatus Micrarchaeota archaeon]